MVKYSVIFALIMFLALCALPLTSKKLAETQPPILSPNVSYAFATEPPTPLI